MLSFELGAVVFEAYEILARLGSGGMGTVYKARHIHMEREVALKILSMDNATQSDLVRFQREAQTLSRLNHPNIADVFDFGVGDGRVAFIAMRLVDGVSVQTIIDREGAMTEMETLTVLNQLADALQYAHGQGIVHRDVKPANVILSSRDSDCKAVLVDFGIARVDRGEVKDSTLTSDGALIGSPLYMSPEQCSGSLVTSSTDQYSFGCLAYSMLTGVPPFHGDSALETMVLHRDAKPRTITESIDKPIANELESLILRLLEKDPTDRFDSFSRIHDSLRQIIEAEPASSSPIVVNDQTSPDESKKRILLLFSLVIGAGLIIAAVSFIPISTPSAEEIASQSARKPDSFSSIDTETLEILDGAPIARLKELDESVIREMNAEDSSLDLKFVKLRDKDIKALRRKSQLHALNLSSSHLIGVDLGELGALDLRLLDISRTNIKTLKGVSRIKSLRTLVIKGMSFPAEELSNLCDLEMLEALDIRDVKLEKKQLEAISTIPRLRRLQIGSLANDSDLLCLAKTFIIELTFGQSDFKTVQSLTSLKSLLSLNLSKTKILQEDLSLLSQIPELKVLFFEGVELNRQGVVGLSKCYSLRSLHLSKGTSTTISEELNKELLFTAVFPGAPNPWMNDDAQRMDAVFKENNRKEALSIAERLIQTAVDRQGDDSLLVQQLLSHKAAFLATSSDQQEQKRGRDILRGIEKVCRTKGYKSFLSENLLQQANFLAPDLPGRAEKVLELSKESYRYFDKTSVYPDLARPLRLWILSNAYRAAGKNVASDRTLKEAVFLARRLRRNQKGLSQAQIEVYRMIEKASPPMARPGK